MSLEYNKALVRRWHDAENWKDVGAIKEILAPDFESHHLDHPEPGTRDDAIRYAHMATPEWP